MSGNNTEKTTMRTMTKHADGTVSYEGIPGRWKTLEGRTPIRVSTAMYQYVSHGQTTGAVPWCYTDEMSRGDIIPRHDRVAFREMKPCPACYTHTSTLDADCLECGARMPWAEAVPSFDGLKAAMRETIAGVEAAVRDASKGAARMLDVPPPFAPPDGCAWDIVGESWVLVREVAPSTTPDPETLSTCIDLLTTAARPVSDATRALLVGEVRRLLGVQQ